MRSTLRLKYLTRIEGSTCICWTLKIFLQNNFIFLQNKFIFLQNYFIFLHLNGNYIFGAILSSWLRHTIILKACNISREYKTINVIGWFPWRHENTWWCFDETVVAWIISWQYVNVRPSNIMKLWNYDIRPFSRNISFFLIKYFY